MHASRRHASVVLIAGMAAQAVWLYAVPFSWGWDTTPNLAIGRMYFGLPYEMWNIKFYYPPAYPIFLTLMGVHHAGTIAYLKIGTLFVGGLMPLFLYLMLRPFDTTAAFLSALVFAASFANAVFSTDMMNHHFHGFQLLFMSMLLGWYLWRPNVPLAVLAGIAAALANAGRQVTAFIFYAGVAILALAIFVEQRNVLAPAKGALVLILSFILANTALSVARQSVLGGPFQYGLTYDVGMRAMFQGTYYGASIYQKEFRPGEDFIFVKPENGPASKSLFDAMLRRFEVIDLKSVGLSDTGDKDEALRNLIANPNVRNTYTMWWSLDAMMTPQNGDRLLRDVVIEAVVNHPRILRYHIWNFWTYLFGLPTVNAGNCTKCECPPCFTAAPPGSYRGNFMGAEIFGKVAAPKVINQMASEHERAKRRERYAEPLYAIARQLYVVKPFLTILMFASVLLARGKTRFLMLYCVATVCLIGATTSLAWPVQARYQYPALPYILAGASVTIFEIVRRVAGVARISELRRGSTR